MFDVPLRGSTWLLVGTSALFLFGALCWGIFLSTVLRSQVLAFQISLLTSFLPAFLLSGFIYPVANIPVQIRWISKITPASYYIDIVRDAFLRGGGWGAEWRQILSLLALGMVLYGMAWRQLRRMQVKA